MLGAHSGPSWVLEASFFALAGLGSSRASAAIAHCSLLAATHCPLLPSLHVICSIRWSKGLVQSMLCLVSLLCSALLCSLLLSLLSLLPVCSHSSCPGPSPPPSSPPRVSLLLLTFCPFLPPRPLFTHFASLHLVRVFLFLSRSPPNCISTTLSTRPLLVLLACCAIPSSPKSYSPGIPSSFNLVQCCSKRQATRERARFNSGTLLVEHTHFGSS